MLHCSTYLLQSSRRLRHRIAPRAALLACLAAACGPPTGPASDPDLARISVGDTVRARVDPRLLSVTLDTHSLVDRGGGRIDLAAPRLRAMTRALGPARLRFGGTKADLTFYDLGDVPRTEPPPPDRYVLDRASLDALCAFAAALDLELIFNLNAGPGARDPQGAWDPARARDLVSYARRAGCPVAVWELGNEIGLYRVELGIDVSARQYAADMTRLRRLLDEIDPTARTAGPASAYYPVFGEIAVPILSDFLAAAGPSVDIITWHYYPQQSARCPLITRRAEVDTMLRPENLDEVDRWAAEVEAARDRHAPRAAVWLDETGHAQCSGVEGLSDRFVSGFWWLDQLGRMASRGMPMVFRQSLVGGLYSLIRRDDLSPTPDYFASLAWKQLMGSEALGAKVTVGDMRSGGISSLRAYAHCAPPARGGVTVLVLHLDQTSTRRVAFDARLGEGALYLFDAPALTSPTVRINGREAVVTADGTPAPMQAVPVAAGAEVKLPPASYAFIHFASPQGAVTVCP